MAITLKLTGLQQVLQDLDYRRGRIREAVAVAAREACEVVISRAKEILEAEVYNKNRGEYATAPSGELLNSFSHSVVAVGEQVIVQVLNDSPHAAFLEYGTDYHWVGPTAAAALHWIDPETGADMFSKGHYISGIHAIHFMQRAFDDTRGTIFEIFNQRITEAAFSG
jgi:hypothetical protein